MNDGCILNQKSRRRHKEKGTKEIRTDYLTNVRFLLNYTGDHAQITSTDHQLLMSLMYDIRFTTVEELLLMATNDKSRRAELLYAVWHLVAVGVISCDLTIELSLQAEIWIR